MKRINCSIRTKSSQKADYKIKSCQVSCIWETGRNLNIRQAERKREARIDQSHYSFVCFDIFLSLRKDPSEKQALTGHLLVWSLPLTLYVHYKTFIFPSPQSSKKWLFWYRAFIRKSFSCKELWETQLVDDRKNSPIL